jgi:hypothetical protein
VRARAEGFFSLNPAGVGLCSQCPPDASECIGATLWPKPGYWHSSPTSPQFIKCVRACV